MEHLLSALAEHHGIPTAPRPPDLRWASEDDATLLQDARQRFQEVQSDESDWRQRANDDMRFLAGEHWPEEIAGQRGSRPRMVIDIAGTHVRSVTNEARQRHPGINVSPVDSLADPETAQMLSGLIRNIGQQSNADIAYALCHEQAVGAIGRGFVRVVPVYDDDFSFTQELRILPVPETLSVYFDHLSQVPDGSDAQWAFICEIVPERAFRQQYEVTVEEFQGWSREDTQWYPTGGVRVAEYWFKELHPLQICQLDDGRVVPKTGTQSYPKERVVQERTTLVPTVWQAVICGSAVLSKTRWLGRSIPIAQEIGERYNYDGKPDYRGLLRRLKDPQRLIDYLDSAKAEAIALAPKAPWVLDPRQIEGYEHYWNTANSSNWPYLPYKAGVVDDGGRPIAPPQRMTVETPIMAMVQGSTQAAEQLKAISGHHAPSLGESQGQSGVAIGREQEAGNLPTYHFGDNQRWMVRRVGQLLCEAIPHYYTEPERVVRILGEDGVAEQVRLNSQHQAGKMRVFDVRAGKYDVTVDAGPSFNTRRQEAVAQTAMLIQAAPQLTPLLADLFVQMTDNPLGGKMAERLKRAMPPGVLLGEPDAEKYQEAQQAQNALDQLPQLQAQLAQMQQAVQTLSETNQLLKLQLANKEREQELELLKVQQQGADQTAKNSLKLEDQRIAAYDSETRRLTVTASEAASDVVGGPYEPGEQG